MDRNIAAGVSLAEMEEANAKKRAEIAAEAAKITPMVVFPGKGYKGPSFGAIGLKT